MHPTITFLIRYKATAMALACTAAIGVPLATLAYTPGRPLALQTLTGKLMMRKHRTYWQIFQKSRLNYGMKVCFVGIFFVYSLLTYFQISSAFQI